MGRGIWGCGAVQQAVLLVEVIGRGGACNRRHARGPRRWGGCCRGMDEDAVAAFRGTQPAVRWAVLFGVGNRRALDDALSSCGVFGGWVAVRWTIHLRAVVFGVWRMVAYCLGVGRPPCNGQRSQAFVCFGGWWCIVGGVKSPLPSPPHR